MCASGGADGRAPTCKVMEATHDEAPHTARGASLGCCILSRSLCRSSSQAAYGRVCRGACSCVWQGCCILLGAGSGLGPGGFACCLDQLLSWGTRLLTGSSSRLNGLGTAAAPAGPAQDAHAHLWWHNLLSFLP